MSDCSLNSVSLSSVFRDDDVIIQLQNGLHKVPVNEATTVCFEAILTEQERLRGVLSDSLAVISVDVILKVRRAFYITRIWNELSIASEIDSSLSKHDTFSDEVKTLFDLIFEVLKLKTIQILDLGDFFALIKAFDEIKIICSKLLPIGKLLPTIDLDLFDKLSYSYSQYFWLSFCRVVFCMLVDHFSSNYQQQLQHIADMRMSPLESITVKTKIMNEMRYLAFRFHGLSNQISDLVSLQATLSVSGKNSWTLFDRLMAKINMQPISCMEFGDLVVFLSPSLLDDQGLCDLFVRSRVNCSRNLAECHIVICRNMSGIFVNDGPQISETMKRKLAEIVSQASAPITVLSHSAVELRILVAAITTLDGVEEAFNFLPIRFNGTELVSSAVIDRIEESLNGFTFTIASLLASNTYEERQASMSDRVLCDEGSRAAFIAVSYVYQHLLDARRKTEVLQKVFEMMITGGLLWIALELSLYAKGEDSDWVSFFLIKTLELMNPIMVRNIFDPFNWDELVSGIEQNVRPLLDSEPTVEDETKQAYIVDQCQALLRQFSKSEKGSGRLRHSLGRYPDQLLLESHNLYIFSVMKTGRFEVFKCLNLISRKIVAVKRFSKADPKFKPGTRNEIDLLRGLKHLNIISFLDSFESENHHFLVLENCEFGLISSKIGKLSELEIREIGRQLLHGIGYLHSNHIVHNNLKPKNIKRTGLGFIKIAEFGDAQMTDSSLEEKQINFQTLNDTSPYVAPESILQLQVETPSDIWSFGCILGKLMSGEEPWSYLPGKMSIVHILTSSNRPPYDIDSLECSTACKDVLRSIFVMNPGERPTASELLKHPYFSNLPNSII